MRLNTIPNKSFRQSFRLDIEGKFIIVINISDIRQKIFAHLFHIVTKSIIIIEAVYVCIEAGPQYDKSTGKKIKPCEAPIRTNPSNIRKK